MARLLFEDCSSRGRECTYRSRKSTIPKMLYSGLRYGIPFVSELQNITTVLKRSKHRAERSKHRAEIYLAEIYRAEIYRAEIYRAEIYRAEIYHVAI